jgi:hypothetical protein
LGSHKTFKQVYASKILIGTKKCASEDEKLIALERSK